MSHDGAGGAAARGQVPARDGAADRAVPWRAAWGGRGRRARGRLGGRVAGAGDVLELVREGFEAALQRDEGLGGEVGGFGHEGAEQKQEGFGEQIGGGAGGGREHERKENIIDGRAQGACVVCLATVGRIGPAPDERALIKN